MIAEPQTQTSMLDLVTRLAELRRRTDLLLKEIRAHENRIVAEAKRRGYLNDLRPGGQFAFACGPMSVVIERFKTGDWVYETVAAVPKEGLPVVE